MAPMSDYRADSLRPNHLLLRIHGIARIHVASRPLVLGTTASPPQSMSSASDISILAQRYIQRRCMSSNNNKDQEASGDKTTPDPKQPAAETSEQEAGRLSSIVRSVGPTLRKVTEWNVGDLLSVYAIVLLIALIIFSPYVVA